MTRPFFSIITCTYNSEKYLLKNLASVKIQTRKDYEHIFVDSYSSDGTRNIINRYKNKFPGKVRLVLTKKMGISNAMNKGIEKAKGRYILFLHSDDSLYNKDVLKQTFSYLMSNPELDWIYGKINVVEENGKSIGQFPSRKIYKIFPKYFLKFYNTIPHQAVFMDKLVFKRFGLFDESLPSAMDADLWLRIRNKTKWHFFDEVISNFMLRKGAQSSDLSRKFENDINTFLVAKRYLNTFEMKIFKIVKLIVDRYNKTYR